MSEYISSKERANVIKKELLTMFKNVSVRKGKGTASSWVETHIYADRPNDCSCEFKTTNWRNEPVKEYRNSSYCENCKIEWHRVDSLATLLANKAMKNAGYEHSTYYADDNSNTEHSEYLQQVSIL